MNKIKELLDKYPVAIIVTITLLIGVVTVGSILVPKVIEFYNLPTTTSEF